MSHMYGIKRAVIMLTPGNFASQLMGQAVTITKISGLKLPINFAPLKVKLVTMLKFCRFDSLNKAQTPFRYHTKFPPQLKQINRVPRLICSFVLEV